MLVDCVVVAKLRLENFVVALTNVDPAVTPPLFKKFPFVQHQGQVLWKETVNMTFPALNDTYRYVIVQNKFTTANVGGLCIAEVQVSAIGM